MKHALPIVVLAALLGACQQKNEVPAAQATPVATSSANAERHALTPEELGTLGAKLRQDPARGDELLTQHGLTRETFEQAIRAVTQDADASRRYAAAYRKGSA